MTQGEFLLDEMQMRNLSISDVAKTLKREASYVAKVLNDEATMSYAEIKLLDPLFGSKGNLWVEMSKISAKNP